MPQVIPTHWQLEVSIIYLRLSSEQKQHFCVVIKQYIIVSIKKEGICKSCIFQKLDDNKKDNVTNYNFGLSV